MGSTINPRSHFTDTDYRWMDSNSGVNKNKSDKHRDNPGRQDIQSLGKQRLNLGRQDVYNSGMHRGNPGRQDTHNTGMYSEGPNRQDVRKRKELSQHPKLIWNPMSTISFSPHSNNKRMKCSVKETQGNIHQSILKFHQAAGGLIPPPPLQNLQGLNLTSQSFQDSSMAENQIYSNSNSLSMGFLYPEKRDSENLGFPLDFTSSLNRSFRSVNGIDSRTHFNPEYQIMKQQGYSSSSFSSAPLLHQTFIRSNPFPNHLPNPNIFSESFDPFISETNQPFSLKSVGSNSKRPLASSTIQSFHLTR